MLWLFPLKRYAHFSGRAGRGEYWQYIAALIAAYVITAILDIGTATGTTPTFSVLLVLGTIVPTYAVTFRRLHDRNMSGWLVGGLWILNGIWFVLNRILEAIDITLLRFPFLLLEWVDLIGTTALTIYLIVQVSKPGDVSDNAYGAPPNYPVAAARTLDEPAAPPHGSLNEHPSNLVDQLERLTRLRDAGALTPEEFAEQKITLLGRSAV